LTDEAGQDSFSFLPVLLGEQPENEPVRRYLPIAAGRGMKTIRRGSWKLITGLGSGGFSQPPTAKPQPGEPPMQLYDLSEDLAETKNLCAQHSEIVKELLAELKSIRGQDKRTSSKGALPLRFRSAARR
jgi:hypothetical protein